MKSCFGYTYPTKSVEALGLEMQTIRDLDESIDILCNYFGEERQDDSLKEEHCPYFGVMWEAGIGLASYLKESDCQGKRVLEIGCGLALPSFIASRYGGNVLATDFHADVPLFLEVNQKKNKINFEYLELNWREEVQRKESSLGLFDLVIGSDILYESQHASQVAQALLRFLAPNGKIILSDPGRAYVQKFVTAMNELGQKEKMIIEKVPAFLTQKNQEKDIFIFEFKD